MALFFKALQDKAGSVEAKEYTIVMLRTLKTLSWLIFIGVMSYIFFLLLQHSPNGFLRGIEQEGRRIYQFLQRKF